jgi:hypothetical protein
MKLLNFSRHSTNASSPHVKVDNGAVKHCTAKARDAGVLSLAKENVTDVVKEHDTIQHIALEVFAHDVAVPGVECSGTDDITGTAPLVYLSPPRFPLSLTKRCERSLVTLW